MEIWKTIEGFEDYEVSNLGEIRRRTPDFLWSRRELKILKSKPNKRGYLMVGLYAKRKHHRKYVHILVAKAFLPNPLNLPEVNHLGTLEDCRAQKLEWRSKAGNMLHTILLGIRGKGKEAGVRFVASRNKWHAYYNKPGSGKTLHIGSFTTKKEALAARKAAIDSLPHVL